jgi:hypothetical protein
MNFVQKWFLIILACMGVGLPFLFLGIELPSTTVTAEMLEGALYRILDEDNADVWTRIPGSLDMTDMKEFYVFNCTNADLVAAKAAAPELTEEGPYQYKYTHEYDNRQYEDEKEIRKARVTFWQKFGHESTSTPSYQEHRALNVAGLKRWRSVKSKLRFQIALEGFFEVFFYGRNNFVRDSAFRTLAQEYHYDYNINKLTDGLGNVTKSMRDAIRNDGRYGLQDKPTNVYMWSTMCDLHDPYMEHEVFTYFGFRVADFKEVLKRFCDRYREATFQFDIHYCSKLNGDHCTGYNYTFNQWLHGSILTKTYGEVSPKPIPGTFEVPIFLQYFYKYLKDVYKKQFSSVSWTDKSYYHLLDTYFEYPDYQTDDSSVLLYNNMKMLFEAGDATPAPYKFTPGSGDGADEELDLSRFEKISHVLKLTKEQSYIMYHYFDYFVNNTVLLMQYNGTLEKERIANYGSRMYRDIGLYMMEYLDMLLYSRTLHSRSKLKGCEEKVKFYFTVAETVNMTDELALALCENTEYNTNISTPVGWKLFLQASAFPNDLAYLVLNSYLMHKVTNFTSQTLDAMLYNGNSNYTKQLTDIQQKIFTFYKGKGICDQSGPSACTKRQLFLGQFFGSTVTMSPYSEAELKTVASVANWWPLIKEYIDTPRKKQNGIYAKDLQVEVPVEFAYLKQFYGQSAISLRDLYNCFTPVGIYDSDMLYLIILRKLTPDQTQLYKTFTDNFFLNSTKYLLRNVEFGPLFGRFIPEQVIFGHRDYLLAEDQKYSDYLYGDDCTLKPWIGYNPHSSHPEDDSFLYLEKTHTKMTGATDNRDIRKYVKYYENDTVTYLQRVRDSSGDKCHFETANPFTTPASTAMASDGLQFNQYPGTSYEGDGHIIIEQNTQRPMNVRRPNDMPHSFRGLELNFFVLEFKNEYMCPNGINIANTSDMTSFYQMHAVVAKSQLKDINPKLTPISLPKNVNYAKRPQESRPPLVAEHESYYEVEPYSGITIHFEKKLLTAIVLYYDELYEPLPDSGRGLFIPYYSLYESARISNASVDMFATHLENAKNSSVTIRVSFLTLGFLLVLPAIAMIIIAFRFRFRPQASTLSGDPGFLFSSQNQDPLLPKTVDVAHSQLVIPAPSNAPRPPEPQAGVEPAPLLPPGPGMSVEQQKSDTSAMPAAAPPADLDQPINESIAILPTPSPEAAPNGNDGQA